MTEDQLALLENARDSVTAARLLLDGGFPGFAVSRAYYAMFYVAEAFLEGEGLSFSKHSGVIAAFGQQFARAGKVPVEYHKHLLRHRTSDSRVITIQAMQSRMNKLRNRSTTPNSFSM